MKATESAFLVARRRSFRRENRLALIFGLLALMLTLLITLHWFLVLAPTLRAEAESRASVLAQAQIQGIERLLSSDAPPDSLKAELASALGGVLLFKDQATGEPFILRVKLRLDYEFFGAPIESLDLDLGSHACDACFEVRVPLYHPGERLLVGFATCYSNPKFLEQLQGELLDKLLWVIGFILFLIGYAWLQTHRLLRRVRESEANLRSVFEAAPFPMALRVDGELGLRQANQAAKRYLDLRQDPGGLLSSESWRALIEAGLPREPGETLETRLAESNGQARWALVSARPVIFSRLGSQLISLVDVSELKATQEELRAASLTDALTGLYNRRYLYQRLAHEIDLVNRYGHPLSIVLFDLDHFKRINDTFGHRMGDDVLVRTAAVLMACVRDVDVVGRHGGEEFMVILPYSCAAQALEVAERIRAALASDIWPLKELRVTISGGVAQFGSETLDEFVERADQQLYEAKRAGRNRVKQAVPAGDREA